MPYLAERKHASSVEDEAARLFGLYSDQIFSFCLRRLGSRSDAEDAVQTTFLYAFRALGQGVVPDSESAWLTAIARNVCRAQLRTLGRRHTFGGTVDLDRIASIERGAEEEELCRSLSAALAAIPERQRRALLLREWHGLSSSEVAAQLGMSRAATYALLTRARRSVVRALTTLPRQAMLGLAALACELRSTVRELLAGGAAKTVAATTVVAAVAVAGVSVQKTLAGERPAHAPSPRSSLSGVSASATPPAPAESSVLRRVDDTGSPLARAAHRREDQPRVATEVVEEPIADERTGEPDVPAHDDSSGEDLSGRDPPREDSPASTSTDPVDELTSSAEELLEDLPLDLPLPDVSVSEDDLLTTELPPLPTADKVADSLPAPDLGLPDPLSTLSGP